MATTGVYRHTKNSRKWIIGFIGYATPSHFFSLHTPYGVRRFERQLGTSREQFEWLLIAAQQSDSLVLTI
jgi:hypothetical protein